MKGLDRWEAVFTSPALWMCAEAASAISQEEEVSKIVKKILECVVEQEPPVNNAVALLAFAVLVTQALPMDMLAIAKRAAKGDVN